MNLGSITEEWLGKQKYKLQSIYAPPTIDGVVYKKLQPIVDGRGSVTELWSHPWVKKEGFKIPKHVYTSATDFNVIKCWHLHKIHTDQFAVISGKLQVSLVDLRKKSKSYLHVNRFFLGTKNPSLLKIPPGVMHGWKALTTPEVLVLNFQTHVYDPKDEFKFQWDCCLSEVWEPKNG